jgi:hypothetical protein
VDEPQLHKLERSLMPARIEPDQAWIAVVFEGAHRAAGRQEPQHGRDTQPQPLQLRVDRKIGALRADRVLVQDVEQLLVPEEVHVGR